MNASFRAAFRESLPLEVKATVERDVFELSAALLPGVRLHVRSFEATESISGLFSFDVVFTSDLDAAALEAAMIGHPVTFSMNVFGQRRRTVQGIAAGLRIDGVRQNEQATQYAARVVPKMWLLRRRKNSRIFQDKTVAEVVSAVLSEWGIAHRWQTTADLPVRAYCVQYQETDYDFVTRLLAESGIFFYFEPPASILGDVAGPLSSTVDAALGTIGEAIGGAVGGTIENSASETLVLCDSAAFYPPIAGEELVEAVADAAAGFAASEIAVGAAIGTALRSPAPSVLYREHDGMYLAEEIVSKLEARRTLRSQAVFLRDYDFERPPLRLTAKASAVSPNTALGAAALGVGAARVGLGVGPVSLTFGSGAALSGAAGLASYDGRMEIYDHHGDFEEVDVARERAAIELEQYRADAAVARGESSCRRFAPGHRFVLDGHAIRELDREYVLTSIVHRGVVAEGGDVGERVTAYSNVFECVPSDVPFRPRRPKREVQQVLESAVVVGPPGEDIHTDEYGRIKVQFYWDREGRQNENSSCWMRVMSSWSGASWGFQFVPRVGMEVLVSFLGGDEDKPVVLGCVYNKTHPTPHVLPLQKTRSGIRTQSTPGGMGFNEITFEDQNGQEELFLRARKDMRELVLNDRLATIGANETVRVGRNQTVEVRGDQATTITGDQKVTLRGDREDTVNGSVDQLVERDARLAVAGNARRTVAGTLHEEVTGDATHRVAGDLTTVVVGDTSRASLFHVEGTSRFSSAELTEIRSDKEVVIRCGKSVLRIMPDAIELVAQEVRVRSPGSGIRFTEGKMEIRAKKGATITSDGITLQSAAAQIALTDVASVAATQISLGTDPPKLDDATNKESKATKIELRDKKQRPIPHQHYVVLTKAGTRIGGMVGTDGKDEIYLEKGDKVVFPEVGRAKKR